MSPHVVGTSLKGTLMGYQEVVAFCWRHLNLGPCHWGRPPLCLLVGPDPCMRLWVSVFLLVVQCRLGHLVCQLMSSCLQVAELDVYSAHDKAVRFWLGARQDLQEWKHMHTLFPMLRDLQGPNRSHLLADLSIKSEGKVVLILLSENASQLEYRVFHHNLENGR